MLLQSRHHRMLIMGCHNARASAPEQCHVSLMGCSHSTTLRATANWVVCNPQQQLCSPEHA